MMQFLSIFLLAGNYLAAVTSSTNSFPSEYETLEPIPFVGESTFSEDE